MVNTESYKYYAWLQMAVARGLGWPSSHLTGHHTAAAPKHSLCFFSSVSEEMVMHIDMHLQSGDVSVYWLWLLLDISESFSLSPNCTGIRHRSSWKLHSKFSSCFRTRLSVFHIWRDRGNIVPSSIVTWMELALSCITLQSSLIYNMGMGVKFIHRQHQNVPSACMTKVETMMWVNLTTVSML